MANADLLWIAAMLLGLCLAVRTAAVRGLSTVTMYWAAVGGLAAGLLGARGLYLLMSGIRGSDVPAGWFGPRAYYGGLFAGVAVAVLVFRWLRADTRRYLDAAAPAIALAYAVGRVGCFVNGDDAGGVTALPWAVTYGPGTEAFAGQAVAGLISAGASHTLPVHPVQLYESLIALGLFVILRPERRTLGVAFGILCVVQAVSRSAFELLRADSLWMGAVSFTQALSVVPFAFGVALILPALRGVPRASGASQGAVV